MSLSERSWNVSNMSGIGCAKLFHLSGVSTLLCSSTDTLRWSLSASVAASCSSARRGELNAPSNGLGVIEFCVPEICRGGEMDTGSASFGDPRDLARSCRVPRSSFSHHSSALFSVSNLCGGGQCSSLLSAGANKPTIDRPWPTSSLRDMLESTRVTFLRCRTRLSRTSTSAAE
ncbi:hypothetical protein MPH_03210 [Macrophomina phaseolina MS6]|uniref:Uncharacterized protein n=1 Tax=Macrophomina phaseolina (strain MS6) TaxID=1126212 RepID=K2S2U3_MACPH|nr:hypothetical protein MPH_03210 [Macrophomina phaseolina MS6]